MNYEIKTVGDFLKVPEDRIDACLIEFKEFISTARALTELAKLCGEAAGASDVDCITEIFDWIDDGKRNVTISIMAGDSTPPIRQSEPAK